MRLLLRFALSGLDGQRGRSLLTILGMAIGTASVVAVISIGLVGRDYVVGLIEGVGTNLVIIYSKDEGTNPEQVTFGDIEAIEAQVPYVSAIAPVLSEMQSISIRNDPKALRVLGTPPAYAAVRNLVMTSGRFISEQERAYIVQSVQSLPPVDSVPWRRLCCHPAFMATYTCHFTVRFPAPSLSLPQA